MTAKEAARKSGIPDNRIYILDVPKEFTGGKGAPSGMKTVDDFIREGQKLDRLEPLKWQKGDGAKKTAFLCYSSGTSGLPVSDHKPSWMRCLISLVERRHDLSQERHCKHQ